jgi:hypothetical protein
MRHAAIAQSPLTLAMSLASVRCALIPPSCFALARPVTQLLAPTTAVALASVIADAHVECLAALKASDLYEVELMPAGHAAGKADLDNVRGERRLYPSRGRASASLRRPPGRSGKSHCASPRVRVSLV